MWTKQNRTTYFDYDNLMTTENKIMFLPSFCTTFPSRVSPLFFFCWELLPMLYDKNANKANKEKTSMLKHKKVEMQLTNNENL